MPGKTFVVLYTGDSMEHAMPVAATDDPTMIHQVAADAIERIAQTPGSTPIRAALNKDRLHILQHIITEQGVMLQ